MCRTQLIIWLCWALTMHKSQAHTLDRAFFAMTRREASAALIIVCLSRALRIGNLLIAPMHFDRLGWLGAPTLSKVRLQELARR